MVDNIPRGPQRVWVQNPVGSPIPVALVAGGEDETVFNFDETGALTTIDVVHHYIHTGILFRAHHVFLNVGNGSNVDFLFVTPDTVTEPHFEGSIYTSGGALIYFYRQTTTSNNGTPMAVYNANQRSGKVNTVLPFYSPTVTNAGTQIDALLVGAGQVRGGQVRSDLEWELNRNLKYLVRVNSLAASNTIIGRFNWYEFTE